MNDYCYEDLIKKDNGRLGFFFPILAYTSFTIFAVLFNVIPMILGYNIIYFTGMISFGIWFIIHLSIKKLKVEYELSIVNDQFTVTSITDGKKREVLADFSLRDADYIGPVTKDRFSADKEKAAFALNITGDKDLQMSDDTWYILVNGGSYRYVVSFKFLDEMYQNFRRFNPRGTEFMRITSKVKEDEGSLNE